MSDYIPGSPIADVDDPMKEGVGAAAWADRIDRVDLTLTGEPKIQPMSILDGWHVDENDRDPRGMEVMALDNKIIAKVTDIWVDRSEPQIRYLQIDVEGAAEGMPILAPMGFCVLTPRGIQIKALLSKHFADIPRPKAKDQVTLLEEDKIMAYFAGGYRYSDPQGLQPVF